LLAQPPFRKGAEDAAAAIARDKPDKTAAAALSGLARVPLTLISARGTLGSLLAGRTISSRFRPSSDRSTETPIFRRLLLR
jgi:hypothetical protein